VPARRATRVPPIAAVREGSTLPPSRFAAHSLKTALAVIAASVAAICVGIFASGIATLAVVLLLVFGILGLFVGVAFAAPHMVVPLTRLVGWQPAAAAASPANSPTRTPCATRAAPPRPPPR
jgi:putative ABC transport system permease protein